MRCRIAPPLPSRVGDPHGGRTISRANPVSVRRTHVATLSEMPELTGENAAQLTDSQPAASERPIVRTSGLPSSLRDVGEKLADGVDLTVNLRFEGHRPRTWAGQVHVGLRASTAKTCEITSSFRILFVTKVPFHPILNQGHRLRGAEVVCAPAEFATHVRS